MRGLGGWFEFGDVAAARFGFAHFAAAAGVVVAALFVFGLGLEGRDGNAAALRIDGDEGEIGGGDVAVDAARARFPPRP